MTPPASGVERGSVGLLTVLAALLVTTVGLTLAVAATDVTVAAVRARTAADAAALAAAGAAPLAGGDGDTLSAAERLAAANGAQLVGCCGGRSRHPRGGAPVVVVEVAVRPRLALLRVVTVRARAAAGLRPAEAPPEAFEAARWKPSACACVCVHVRTLRPSCVVVPGSTATRCPTGHTSCEGGRV